MLSIRPMGFPRPARGILFPSFSSFLSQTLGQMFVFLTYSSLAAGLQKVGGAQQWHGNPVPAWGALRWEQWLAGLLPAPHGHSLWKAGWGGSWHICWAHWKPWVLRGKGTFSWVFCPKSINQPQRNTRKARSGFLAGTVIIKAMGLLCIFCSRWPWAEFRGRSSAAFACLGLRTLEVREEKLHPEEQREPGSGVFAAALLSFPLCGGWLSANLWTASSWHVNRGWSDQSWGAVTSKWGCCSQSAGHFVGAL